MCVRVFPSLRNTTIEAREMACKKVELSHPSQLREYIWKEIIGAQTPALEAEPPHKWTPVTWFHGQWPCLTAETCFWS